VAGIQLGTLQIAQRRLPQQAAAGKVLRQLAKPTDVSNIHSIFILEHRACSSRAFFVLVMEILEAGCAFGNPQPDYDR